MDRVDRWLNAQRGWRRVLVAWVALAPILLDAGLLWSGWGNVHDATVATGSVLVRVAVAVVAGIPLAAVGVRLGLWSRKSRPWEPGFSWRMIAAIYVLMSSASVAVYGDTRTWAWQHRHVPHNALFLMDAAAFVLFIWNLLYLRKLRRQAEKAQAAAS